MNKIQLQNAQSERDHEFRSNCTYWGLCCVAFLALLMLIYKLALHAPESLKPVLVIISKALDKNFYYIAAIFVLLFYTCVLKKDIAAQKKQIEDLSNKE